MGRYALRLKRLLVHNVLHADDTPHRIALGVTIAVFIAFLPLVGAQTVIAVGIAALLRANKAVCVPIVWITNPITLVPIYSGCLALGRFVMPDSEKTDQALSNLTEAMSFWQAEFWTRFTDWAFWRGTLEMLVGLGVELWVGCVIVGGVGAAIAYPLSRWGVGRYRERRRQRALRRSLFRARLKAGDTPEPG